VLHIRATPALLRYIVEKGSIAVAGTSLTVNSVDAETFSIAIIPHTRDATTLGALAVGDRVNLEVDILAKHVEKLIAR
jgi:riboflavin synthase